jgi:hypothetical protein
MRRTTGRSYVPAAALIGAAFLSGSFWLAPAWSAQPASHVLGLLRVAMLVAAVAGASLSRPPTPPALAAAAEFQHQAAA